LKKRGISIRINTDGQANLVHGRNILPELAGLVDCVSVSLNASDGLTYATLCNSPFGESGFAAVIEFLKEAKKHIPRVVATAVTVPGIDMAAVRRLAESLGVEFREREYAEVG
jgi:TatD DNase family protein